MIFIENNSYSSEKWSGVQLAPGMETFVSVERLFKFNMVKPYSNCDIDNDSPDRFDSELYNLILDSDYQYSQQLCFEQCYQRESISDCNCTDSYFVSLFATDNCQTDTQVACNNKVFYEKFPKNNFIQKTCMPLCPLECNRTEYRTSLSTSQILGEKYLDLIKPNARLHADFVHRPLNLASARDSVVEMGIYYESMSYTHSSETAKIDVVALLAAIGGHLGLFLGVSVFSVCEMVEVLIEIFFLKRRKTVRI